MRYWLPLALLCVAACGGAPRVRFDHDVCFINNAPAGIEQVEREETLISQHMAQRQPLFILLAALVVLLGGAGYILRIVDVVAVRNEDGTGFVDRLRLALDRHRAHPVRYFTMLGAAFTLLLCACGFYGILDSDKRAGQQDLGLLQFCHLALRTDDENNVLSQQRQNLEALSATAGQIRTLVDQLPPDEQKKAQLVISQVSQALDKQDKALADSLDKNAEAAARADERTEQVERGITSVATGVLALKSVPDALVDLAKNQQGLDARLSAVDAELGKSAQAGAAADAGERAAAAADAQKLDAALSVIAAKLDKSAQVDAAADAGERADVAALAKRVGALEARARAQTTRPPAAKAAAKPRPS